MINIVSKLMILTPRIIALLIMLLFLHSSSILLYGKITGVEGEDVVIGTTTTTTISTGGEITGETTDKSDENIIFDVIDFGSVTGGGFPSGGGGASSASTSASTSSTTTSTTSPPTTPTSSSTTTTVPSGGGGSSKPKTTTTTTASTSSTTTTTISGSGTLPECPTEYQSCQGRVEEKCVCGGRETCYIGDYCCAADGTCEYGLSYCLYGSCRGSVPFPGPEEPTTTSSTSSTTTTTTMPEPLPSCPSDRRSCESTVDYKCICGGGETCYVGDYCCAASGLCEYGLSYCRHPSGPCAA